MSAAPGEWLVRGRQHQRNGHPVDAMLCFRRAVRETPDAVEPRFHLGEVLWQLGRLPDAIASWREAAALAPDHPAVQTALAEALLGTGAAAAAREVAARRLAAHPRDARARSIVAVADLGGNASDVAAVGALVEAVTKNPALVGVTSIAGTLAHAVDRADAPVVAPILDAIAALDATAERVAAMPATLVAQVVERAAAASSPAHLAQWLAAARTRPWAAADHDALRRIAVVGARSGASADRVLTQHYAALCDRAARAIPALGWPRRTHGNALRVVAVVAPSATPDALLERLRAACALTVATLGATALGGGSIALVETPDLADARRLAALDPDVLVDLAGLATRAGPLLARRPARLTLTIAGPMANAQPLVDESLPDADALLARLRMLQASLSTEDDAIPDAATLAARWTDAVAAHSRGDRASARIGYDAVLVAEPQFAPAHFLAGRLHADEGALDPARREFAAALALAPDYVEARVAAVRAAVDDGDVPTAEALAAAGVARTDNPAAALLRAWGSVRLAARDGAGAAERFEAALAREPIDGETHYNHGVALQMQRLHGEAARAYQRALTFEPELVAADFNLGVIFAEEGNPDAAIRAFTHVLARDPAHVMAYRGLGDALFATRRYDDWLANFAQFEAQCPQALPLAVHALELSQWTGDFARVERYLDGLRKEAFRAANVRQLADAFEELLYLLLFFDIEPELYARVAQTYAQTAARVYGPPRPAARTRRPGRLRVGYLSADLRNHVMGKMMWSAIQHHDRTRVDVRFYSMSHERDAWTERLASAGDAFTVVAGMTDRAAADAIAADDLDLLVDLSTHTRGARQGIVAAKPARVALTHVASAGIAGLTAVDFRLTDAWCDVDEGPPPSSEVLLPMRGCVYPYRHVAPVPTPALTRASLGIAEDAVVIGAFVTGMKLSRRCLTLWREVLARVPGARLAFSPLDPAQRPLYVRLAAAGGIPAERLAFVAQGADDAVNQARFRLVDFVLDPMPYGGANGTLEALDMGVPVVTLAGRRHGERTSYSMLVNLGVTQTVADSGKHYVDLAVRLATDAAFMRDVRAAIRRGLVASPLTDMPAHARNLEAAYREALRLRAPQALADAQDAAPP